MVSNQVSILRTYEQPYALCFTAGDLKEAIPAENVFFGPAGQLLDSLSEGDSGHNIWAVDQDCICMKRSARNSFSSRLQIRGRNYDHLVRKVIHVRLTKKHTIKRRSFLRIKTKTRLSLALLRTLRCSWARNPTAIAVINLCSYVYSGIE